MLKSLLLLASSALFAPLGAAQNAVRVPLQDVPSFLGWVQDELIVAVAPDTVEGLVVAVDAQGLPRVNRPGLQAVIDAEQVVRFRRQFPGAVREQPGSPRPDLTVYYKAKLGPGGDLEAALQAFERDPDVEHVERIGIHSLYQVPNDTYYQNPPPSFPYDQWHYWDTSSIDAESAWDQQTGDPSVVVGVLDSGVRYFHIDLGGNSAQWGPSNPFAGGNVFINGAETPGNGIDDDGNGYVDDTIGWDFVETAGGFGVTCIDGDCGTADNDPDDFNGHGTHVAGTIGAITNNGLQVAGVAGGFGDGTQAGGGNGSKVIPCRIGYHARYQGFVTGVVRMDYAAEAMNYLAGLIDDGVDVAAINCSWGSSNSGGLNAGVDALLARDVLIAHAAGNSNSSSPDFLGTKAGVVSVAATDRAGQGASFTNYGSWVEVAAPGVDVLSTYRNPDDPDPTAHYIALLSGTSMSAPHVAGIAALIESCAPGLSLAAKTALILDNTTPYSDPRNLGSGIANASLALTAASCGGGCDITADFDASPTAGCSALAVSFTDTSTGAGINAWAWNFGDGGSSTAQNPSHTYTAPGTYSVSLTASSASCSDSVTQVGLVVVSAAPLADFSASSTSGNAPLTVDFTDLTSGGPTSWSWTFGDGGTATAQNPSHTYAAAGTYTVALTASNACGSGGETKLGYIVVSDPPPATMLVVDSIAVVRENLGGGNKRGVATVTVVDDAGNPVAGALVTGDFSGKTSESVTPATTDASGQVVFFSSGAKGGGTWCFTVTSATHATLSPAAVPVTGCE